MSLFSFALSMHINSFFLSFSFSCCVWREEDTYTHTYIWRTSLQYMKYAHIQKQLQVINDELYIDDDSSFVWAKTNVKLQKWRVCMCVCVCRRELSKKSWWWTRTARNNKCVHVIIYMWQRGPSSNTAGKTETHCLMPLSCYTYIYIQQNRVKGATTVTQWKITKPEF
jgi:hypothetical protein